MSPETRARLGEAARKHCEAGFSYEAMLDKMERIYREASGRA
jgi:glycosyltransferase involved in cell wall biosynthesis